MVAVVTARISRLVHQASLFLYPDGCMNSPASARNFAQVAPVPLIAAPQFKPKLVAEPDSDSPLTRTVEGHSTQILVVEDEPIIALDIRQRLINAGYQVVAIADNAETALAKALQFMPNLILMDIRINGVTSGIEAAGQIRQQVDIPVVFLTAHADRATLDQAKQVKPFGYIVKPFETHDLVTSIEVALSRHQAELAIAQALRQEREFNQLKSQFISVVSHEFRTPLSIIAMSLDVLSLDSPAKNARAHRSIQRANQALSQLEHLLNEVSVVEQTNDPDLEVLPQWVEVDDFCQELIESLRPLCKPHHQLEFQLHSNLPNPPDALLDLQGLRHVLSNLISNAIKYSPDGGLVQLEVNLTPESAIFSVRDQGLGIPLEDHPRLFDRFYRASNAGTVEGTGLGLSIVHQCVMRQGGEITLDSEVGQGSCFTVTLPRQNIAGAEHPPR
jgi:signal transduction histidine kinase